ncbi:NAD(P)-dependent oxidoreductase [Allosphingosinicella deserti]|uniref:Hydroxyacid dehydrogenase n=1 Tax=Allosphingosinicella deserti TaxID=2116704 RepID=A0A2P7QJH1_9SPHN|nr:NAD(P)-dependent oxidoreductase [Sphingomonas deserti]PSJ38116.1 hypothetical protein C7I55_20805 [Sphingomonas deserti]
MRVSVFSTKRYDRNHLQVANAAAGAPHELVFLEPHLGASTVMLAAGTEAVCAFVNDLANRTVLTALRDLGVRGIVLRCAGYNNVDLVVAEALGLPVGRVPAYSPYAAAEHAAALILSLNRKIHRAYARVRESNFELDGLIGFDLHGRTAGVVGTGKIGYLGLDVYEEEGDLFFDDLSGEVLQDDAFARLLTFPNVLITGHQAFFTEEALKAIADTTIANLSALERTGLPVHQVRSEQVIAQL